MEKISELAELATSQPNECHQILAEKPLDCFKALKNCPDSLAELVLEELKVRWKAAEERVKQLDALAKAVNFENKSVEEDRWEIVTELIEKAVQGFDLKAEHAKRKVKLGHRIVFETKLLLVINRAFDRAEAVLKDFYALHNDRDAAGYERDDLRMEIRLCDMCFVEVHTGFLKSYLGVDW
ncbi:unnamed protein product [Bursaphelenchus xylophilus]|uniref:(pine wood nematode) hypothetical protein n=1 Tax=Bursaphelenchus xylophilus TaxID=6326 RepID=A0A1I7RTE8_BURXY|nr:unnamed protein product [Bursaphelenchus xylophilus]CAG9122480.1 unnamed protein product [Bursaphelenchus xylophilus]